jgi:hypothetical protein
MPIFYLGERTLIVYQINVMVSIRKLPYHLLSSIKLFLLILFHFYVKSSIDYINNQ